MIINRLTPDFVFEDERGALTQLVSKGYAQVNVVFSKENSLRGSHYHAENTEVFYVISGELTVDASNESGSESCDFFAGDMFSLPAGTAHKMSFLKDTVLVVLYDKGVEGPDGTKDIIPTEVVV